jgi:hypothetical protein
MVDQLLPTRLIDVGSTQEEPSLICLPQGSKGIYAALSYCWGSTAQCTLTSTILKIGTAKFQMAALPKTIQDSILICRNLGFKYIWIDALCIIQDSVDRVDWMRESSMMDLIFGNAAITIIASASMNSSQGILNAPEPPNSGTCIIPLRAQRRSDDKFCTLGEAHLQFYPRNVNDFEPLSSRAWAFQEYLLSPRILNYQTHQMAWECDSAKLYTSGPLHSDMNRKRKRWEDFISQYTQRDLTFPDDRLIALSGYVKMRFAGLRREALKKMNTAETVSLKFEETYLAGLWKPYLAEHMLWHSSEKQPRPRPTTYRAPTWSWAAIDGPVDFVKIAEMGVRSGIMEHLDTFLATSSLNPFGSIDASPVSYLKVRGYLKRADGIQAPSLSGAVSDQQEFQETIGKSWKIYFDVLDATEPGEEGDLWCLNVTENTALILKPVVKDDMRGKINVFERVGLAIHSSREQWDWFDGVDKTEVYLL